VVFTLAAAAVGQTKLTLGQVNARDGAWP